ncbi:YheC/YheD family endospore coat-associated protein [Neobacillus sp. D3-1R]|uniref:YheC/YheD family endospore coat-associated protein n=1 Tax=Neobacillus sp. D3-1R TaxID=3445778 RepID=UPI003FA04CC6
MNTFGILTTKDTEIHYFTEIAKRASHVGMTCCRFFPIDIDPISQEVTGQMFNSENNKWEHSVFPIPKILYDRCFYSRDSLSQKCIPIVSWLKSREDIYFLGYGLPNKLELYHVLNQSSLSPYLPPSKPIKLPTDVIKELQTVEKIVLKPIAGSQGNGIFLIEAGPQKLISVKTFNRRKHIYREFTQSTIFLSWMDTLLSKMDYFMQPYLELTNKLGEPFDVRALLQKQENGEWTERGRGIRVGHKDGILSNISAGGYIREYEPWIKQLFSTSFEYIDNELNDILFKLPSILENTFMPLFELGIDIGIAKNGGIWILDINSKPGRKVIQETSPGKNDELYYAPLLYGKTLTNSENKERKRYDAKTLSN